VPSITEVNYKQFDTVRLFFSKTNFQFASVLVKFKLKAKSSLDWLPSNVFTGRFRTNVRYSTVGAQAIKETNSPQGKFESM